MALDINSVAIIGYSLLETGLGLLERESSSITSSAPKGNTHAEIIARSIDTEKKGRKLINDSYKLQFIGQRLVAVLLNKSGDTVIPHEIMKKLGGYEGRVKYLISQYEAIYGQGFVNPMGFFTHETREEYLRRALPHDTL